MELSNESTVTCRNQDHNQDNRQSSKSLTQCATPSANHHTQQERYTALVSYADPTRLPPEPLKTITAHHTYHYKMIRPFYPQAPGAIPFSPSPPPFSQRLEY